MHSKTVLIATLAALAGLATAAPLNRSIIASSPTGVCVRLPSPGRCREMYKNDGGLNNPNCQLIIEKCGEGVPDI